MSDVDTDNNAPEPVGRPFEKGKSGNPGGAPKWLKSVRESLKSLTPLAKSTLESVMTSADKDSDRVAAAKVVLDYTVPKPKQTHRLEHKGDPLATLTPEQLVEFIKGKKE